MKVSALNVVLLVIILILVSVIISNSLVNDCPDSNQKLEFEKVFTAAETALMIEKQGYNSAEYPSYLWCFDVCGPLCGDLGYKYLDSVQLAPDVKGDLSKDFCKCICVE